MARLYALLSAYVSACVSICLSVYLPICLCFVCLSVCLPVRLSVCVSSACLSVGLCVCPSNYFASNSILTIISSQFSHFNFYYVKRRIRIFLWRNKIKRREEKKSWSRSFVLCGTFRAFLCFLWLVRRWQWRRRWKRRMWRRWIYFSIT